GGHRRRARHQQALGAEQADQEPGGGDRREGAEELGADHGADLVERQVEARAEQGEGGPVQGLQGAEEEEGREADEQDGAAVGVAEGVGGHVLERYRFALRRAARAHRGAFASAAATAAAGGRAPGARRPPRGPVYSCPGSVRRRPKWQKASNGYT